MHPDYLIHYNKNHSAKNGQFTSGDGDGDGISNDHAHRSKKNLTKKQKIMRNARIIGGGVAEAAVSGNKQSWIGLGLLGTSFVSSVATAKLADTAYNKGWKSPEGVGAIVTGVAGLGLSTVGLLNMYQGNKKAYEKG